jgi:hypothetical protein
MEREKYKGYTISRNTKTVYHTCKKSGHTWSEDIVLKTYTIYGYGILSGINNRYRTIEGAKKYIDFVLRHGLNKISQK